MLLCKIGFLSLFSLKLEALIAHMLLAALLFVVVLLFLSLLLFVMLFSLEISLFEISSLFFSFKSSINSPKIL
jgi:hypothetical protein